MTGGQRLALTDHAGLILAAGFSSRMGTLKPLLRLGEYTLLEHAIRSMLLAGVHDVFVVLGHRATEIEASLTCRAQVEIVYNVAYASGMFSSVQAGIRAILAKENPYQTFFMLPGDHPFIAPELPGELAVAAEQSGKGIVLPRYQGKNGHPCRIAMRYAQEILTSDFEQGMRSLYQQHEEDILQMPTVCADILFDLDRPEEYQQALARLAKLQRADGA